MAAILLGCVVVGFFVSAIAWGMVYPEIEEAIEKHKIAVSETKHKYNARARSRYVTKRFLEEAPESALKSRVRLLDTLQMLLLGAIVVLAVLVKFFDLR